MSKQDLLIIVGCEELPARYVQFSANSLQKNLLSLLKRIEHGASTTYATPRRIAVHIKDVNSNVKTDTSTVTGPPADRAFKDGEPTKAAIGFARGKGVDVSELKIIDGPRGPVVAVEVQTGGESVVEILQTGLENAVLKMDF
jgi:glycyl-tRNA synthetase beta chain